MSSAADGAAPRLLAVIGFVGRIEPRKGPLDLVRAAPAIRAARPGARIGVVGDDACDADREYLQAVREGGDVEHYRWVDGAAGLHYRWVDGAAGLIRRLDVLVAPSRREPLGTVGG